MNAWNRITGIKAKRLAETDNLNRREWLEMRKRGIGGSDISAIAGVNPWKSAIHVFLEKTGRYETPPNEKMKWGNLLEQPVAQEYSDSVGVKIQRVKAVLEDPDCPHFLANIDRMIIKNGHELNPAVPTHNNLLNNGNGILEVKTTGWAQAWEGGEIPDMYYLQLQWYLMVTGLKWGQFAVLVSGQDFLTSHVIVADKEMHANMKVIADKFWNNHVKKDVAPEPSLGKADYDAMGLLYPDSHDNTVQLSDELNEIFDKRKRLNDSIKQAEAQKSFINAKALRVIENNRYGVTSKWKITKVIKNNVCFNKKAFKEDHPSLYSEYCYSSQSVYPLIREIKAKNKK